MKITVVSLQGLMDGNRDAASIRKESERAMKSKPHCVSSASGRTAAEAVNYCERNKLSYILTCVEGRYCVELIP